MQHKQQSSISNNHLTSFQTLAYLGIIDSVVYLCEVRFYMLKRKLVVYIY